MISTGLMRPPSKQRPDRTDEVQVLFATIGLVVSFKEMVEDASSIFIFSNNRSVTILRSRRFSIVSSSRTRRIFAMVEGVADDGSLGHRNIQHTVRYTELSPDRFRDFWR